jgi:hypothetical protein
MHGRGCFCFFYIFGWTKSFCKMRSVGAFLSCRAPSDCMSWPLGDECEAQRVLKDSYFLQVLLRGNHEVTAGWVMPLNSLILVTYPSLH